MDSTTLIVLILILLGFFAAKGKQFKIPGIGALAEKAAR